MGTVLRFRGRRVLVTTQGDDRKKDFYCACANQYSPDPFEYEQNGNSEESSCDVHSEQELLSPEIKYKKSRKSKTPQSRPKTSESGGQET